MRGDGKANTASQSFKKEFFDAIAKGEKREKYRERKDWTLRLQGREYDIIRSRNGYVEASLLEQVRVQLAKDRDSFFTLLMR